MFLGVQCCWERQRERHRERQRQRQREQERQRSQNRIEAQIEADCKLNVTRMLTAQIERYSRLPNDHPDKKSFGERILARERFLLARERIQAQIRFEPVFRQQSGSSNLAAIWQQ